jgi:hypothetical protein
MMDRGKEEALQNPCPALGTPLSHSQVTFTGAKTRLGILLCAAIGRLSCIDFAQQRSNARPLPISGDGRVERLTPKRRFIQTTSSIISWYPSTVKQIGSHRSKVLVSLFLLAPVLRHRVVRRL